MLVHIYCDGSCSGNPGGGGWAAYLAVPGQPDRDKTISGRVEQATNNQMELMAAIEGLKALKRPCEVDLFSDSTYLCYTMVKGWKRKANLELWQELDRLAAIHQVTWTWCRRNSLPQLAECNKLAKKQSGAG